VRALLTIGDVDHTHQISFTFFVFWCPFWQANFWQIEMPIKKIVISISLPLSRFRFWPMFKFWIKLKFFRALLKITVVNRKCHSGRDGDLKKRHDGAWSGTPLDFWNLSETIFKKHIIVPKLNTRVDSAIGNTGLTQAARSDLLILTTVIKNKPRIILLFVLCNVI